MPSSTHAKFSASSAARWIECPGSIQAIDALPENERDRESTYSREGHASHFLAEQCLAKGHDPMEYQDLWISDFGVISEGTQEPEAPGHWFEITEEMVDAVNLYLEVVNEHLDRLGRAELFVERTVYPVPHLQDETYGTADCLVHKRGEELVVTDFKYGQGIPVDAERNYQLMHYALGGLRSVNGLRDTPVVRIVVVQPRSKRGQAVQEWLTDANELLEFQALVEQKIGEAREPDAPLVPGKHCHDHFCPVAPRCPALDRLSYESAVAHFPDDLEEIGEPKAHVRLPDPNDPADLARAKAVADLVAWWASEVNAMVHAAVERGVKVPDTHGGHYKRVRGRSNRQWKDAEDVERRLKNKAGVSVDDIYDRKLRSPAQLEKNRKIGKKWVEKHAVKPEGKPTLVPSTDRRKALPPAIDALSSVPEEDRG